jgi:hypothetical protein
MISTYNFSKPSVKPVFEGAAATPSTAFAPSRGRLRGSP